MKSSPVFYTLLKRIQRRKEVTIGFRKSNGRLCRASSLQRYDMSERLCCGFSPDSRKPLMSHGPFPVVREYPCDPYREIWVWVRIAPPSDRVFESMFPLTKDLTHFGYPF